MLRWAAANTFASIRDSLSCETLPFFAHLAEAHPLLERALAKVGATELGRVFIVKLKPGGRVYPHSDVGTYADHFERFHLCLKAGPGFEYSVQHPTGPVESANMRAGELWWFNHKRTHWAYNGDAEERITIILDCVAPAFKRKRDVLALGVGYRYEGDARA
jgi:hypothetical protein